ncbi:MAG: N-acetyltransferase [Alphaproteobacteria bacterium]|nr:N-acetyltransferase [Alphaproteobacteria bacterium]
MTLRLVEPEPRHTEGWRRWRTDPDSRRFMALPAGDLSAWAKKLAKAKTDLADRTGGLYRWMAEDDGVPVGSVSLSSVDWNHLSGEVGYVIAPEMRGKGYGRAMAEAALALGFAGELERITAYICTDNPASIGLAERLGFQREGLLRRHAVIEGARRDHYLYGLLKEEWKTPLATG